MKTISEGNTGFSIGLGVEDITKFIIISRVTTNTLTHSKDFISRRRKHPGVPQKSFFDWLSLRHIFVNPRLK